MLNIMCGISGSGKSTYISRKANPGDIVICPDTVRLTKFGNINDQSHGKEVFDICYEELKRNRKVFDGDVWFDATSLNKDSIEKLLELWVGNNSFLEVVIYVTTDSFNLELCKGRIESDIAIGVCRSNVPPEVSDKQFARFETLAKNLPTYLPEWKNKYNKNITIMYI